MTDKRLRKLLRKYAEGKCSDEEINELNRFYERLDVENTTELPSYISENWQRFSANEYVLLQSRIEKENKNRGKIIRFKLYKTAAAIIMLSAISCALYLSIYKGRTSTTKYKRVADIHPGSDGALLTLSDGSTVILDSLQKNTDLMQGHSRLVNSGGKLVYKTADTASSVNMFNTLSTPRGKQYGLVLPDGSKVWLNASSSIRFPVAFSPKERKVEIQGEAYFEIVHNDKVPFKIVAGTSEITDIGTKFDVSAYDNENTLKTTLIEGAVKVNNRILRPGEQAQVQKNGTLRVTELQDVAGAVAWRKGLICFSAEDFPTLMRQISRWYDIDIIVKGDISRYHITGTLPRNMELSDVLKILESYGLKFELSDGRLIVTGKDAKDP